MQKRIFGLCLLRRRRVLMLKRRKDVKLLCQTNQHLSQKRERKRKRRERTQLPKKKQINHKWLSHHF
jgi:hypothetical protein